MCQYYHVFRYMCLHGELVKISYCDRARELGLDTLSMLALEGTDVTNTAMGQPDPSTLSNYNSSPHIDSPLHPPSQQQLHQNMPITMGCAAMLSSPAPETFRLQNAHLPASAELNYGLALQQHSSTVEEKNNSDIETSPRSKHARKSLPTQWLPAGRGPKLATAQRAKDREYKKSSIGGSPAESNKTLRGTRSSLELDRSYGASEGATFLTKEALAAVDKSIASPSHSTSPASPTKAQKSAWSTPTISPRHGTSRISATTVRRMSPTKQMLIGSDMGSSGVQRRRSSAATSTGDTVFNTAHGSPVKSSTDSEDSFKSFGDDLQVDDAATSLASQHSAYEAEHQIGKDSGLPKSTASTSSTAQIYSHRPKLSLDTETPAALQSTTISSSASSADILHSVASASPASRIPRAAVGAPTSSRAHTFGSTRKRAHSANSSCGIVHVQEVGAPCSSSSTPPRTPKAAGARHVRTVNSVGATPIIPEKSTSGHIAFKHTPQLAAASTDDTGRTSSTPFEDQLSLMLRCNMSTMPVSTGLLPATPGASAEHFSAINNQDTMSLEQISNPLSSANAVASSSAGDPVMADPAVIYSRKKSPASVPGSVTENDNSEATTSSTRRTSMTTNLSSTHDTAKLETKAKPRESEDGSTHSTCASQASYLRATAPEFVPQVPGIGDAIHNAVAIFPSAAYPNPWFTPGFHPTFYASPGIYEWSIQSAYQQGYQKGRVNSKRRTRHFMKQGSASGTAKTQHGGPAVTASTSEATSHEKPAQHSIAPPPAPPATPVTPEQQPVELTEATTKPHTDEQAHTEKTLDDDISEAFSSQMLLIERHSPTDNSITQRPEKSLDITSIRNVYSNLKPEYSSFHTMPRRRTDNQQSPRRNFQRSDNGLYSHGPRYGAGFPVDQMTFPAPMAPGGRPLRPNDFRFETSSNSWYVPGTNGPAGCGELQIIGSAENSGPLPCVYCYPGRPLQ